MAHRETIIPAAKAVYQMVPSIVRDSLDIPSKLDLWTSCIVYAEGVFQGCGETAEESANGPQAGRWLRARAIMLRTLVASGVSPIQAVPMVDGDLYSAADDAIMMELSKRPITVIPRVFCPEARLTLS
jgi:hypothetical protein